MVSILRKIFMVERHYDREVFFMIKRSLKRSKTVLLSLLAAAMLVFPANAANVRGKVTNVDSKTISGWAWNPEDTNDVQEVEIHICQAGDPLPIKYLHVTANKYREDLVADLKDGWHGFSADVDWSSLNGSSFTVKAYAVKDGKFYALGDSIRYDKASGTSAKSTASQKPTGANLSAAATPTASAPAAPQSSAPTAAAPISAGPGYQTKGTDTSGTTKETSLGTFVLCGYCGCAECSGGFGITFSGTVPQPQHTIAADLNVLPLGSKVRIGDIIYTVEDIGSAVQGKMIDIYYADHASAAAHGRTEAEVFLIQ